MQSKVDKTEKAIKRLGNSITGRTDLLGDEKPSFLFPIMIWLLRHLMSCNVDKMLSKASIKFRKFLHPLLMLLVPLFIERKLVFESKNALLGIDAPEPDKHASLPEEPVIWCGNHSFKDDIASTILAARHAYVLFGSLPMFFNTFDGISAYINGILLCNRKVKASKAASVEGAKFVLNAGTDVLMFPEGVWNKTPEKLLIDFWPGAYRLAKETGYKIVPVIHYLADAHKKYKGNVIHTVIADPISMEGLTEQEGLTLLRDTMATWYFLLMERYGRSSREELLGEFDTADDAWESYIAMHAGDVKYYDREIELTADYRPKQIVRPENVWNSVANVEQISLQNAAHVAYAQQIVTQGKKRDFQRRY